MPPDLRGPLLNILVMGLAAGVAAAVLRAKGLPLREAFALRRPSAGQAAAFAALFALLVAAEEAVAQALGSGEVQTWSYSAGATAVRVVGIVLVAPAVEELLFRGVMFSRIAGTRLGPVGAVVLPAALFAGAHVQYWGTDLAFIFADGLFLGVARYRTRSVLLPIALHALGNLFAVWQRLG